MVRPPSHVLIVRHGNRLDAADKEWHLTSPTPYDTPLTYGGFQQARQVGNHISSLLEQAKAAVEVSSDGAVISGKRRRFRIVIHSSPFLRCVQTSVGIASGLAQTPLGSVYEPSDLIVPRSASGCRRSHFKSALLRIDPFLGEWLSPDYFESITPPPGSALMVGGAKAELLRRDDYSMYTEPAPTTPHRSTSSIGSLWNQSPSSAHADSRLASPVAGTDLNASPTAPPSRATSLRKRGYIAPRPMYAVSSGGKIPDGLVAHARDACVMVDYRWDSLRTPLNFGDGGTFGEEWVTMHKRFRAGLKKMINWYANTERPDELLPVQKSSASDDEKSDYYGEEEVGEQEMTTDEDEDEDIETVIIIVSHGAGCNALIGAITHQPVLMDIGIASITMAVRKQGLDYSDALSQTRPQDPVASRLVPLDKMYDIQLSASTEHLRPSTSASFSARSPSSSNIWASANTWGRRSRTGTVGSSLDGPVLSPIIHRESALFADSRSIHVNAADNSFQHDRGSSDKMSKLEADASSPSRGSEPWSSVASSPGLWAPVSSSLRLMDDSDTDGGVDDYDSFLPDFDNKRFGHFAMEETTKSLPNTAPAVQPPLFRSAALDIPSRKPMFSAPIKFNTNFGSKSADERAAHGQLDDYFEGLWGLSPPPSDLVDDCYSTRYWG